MKIVFLDTGYYSDDMANMIEGISIHRNKNTYEIVEGFCDNDGHGTEVVNVFRKYDNKSKIFMVKLPTVEHQTIDEALAFALKYVLDNIQCDVVQISCGTLKHTSELEELVDKLAKKACVISAFDNAGGVSYPAAYKNVLGVDLNLSSNKKDSFEVIPDEIVDIRVSDMYYRIKDNCNIYKIVQGSSYACSFISAMVLKEKKKINKKQLKEKWGIYKGITKKEGRIKVNILLSNVKRTVIFPFNKEIHSIARFEKKFIGGDCQYYDLKHKFLVGKKICEVLKDTNNEKIIRSYDQIDWQEKFDLFVCGHLKEIEQLTGKQLRQEIYLKCKQYNKKLYCFDDMRDVIKQTKENVFYPQISLTDVPQFRYGKLRKPNIPVVCVCGTSSKQGKYTVQLNILEALEKKGINAGFLSTEPNGYLLGANEILPFGYESGCHIESKLTNVANEMIWKLEKQKFELIVTGCQSGSVQYDTINERLLLYKQSYFLNGINPDGIVLVVNSYDSIRYIERTINYLESFTKAKIIFVIINNIFGYDSVNANQIKSLIKKRTLITMMLNNLEHNIIYHEILQYYTGEE